MNQTQSELRQEPATSLQASVMARRRMLLASLGKGSAVIAAVSAPMHSLAAVSVTANGQRCTISGTMSGVHSRETVTDTCAGMSPGYYKKIEHWPNYSSSSNAKATNSVTGGHGTFNKDTHFSSLFGAGSGDGLLSCLQDTSSHQEEFHWTAALLNGTSGSIAVNFPYTAQEVIDLYKAGGNIRSDAYAFFKGYMETHSS